MRKRQITLATFLLLAAALPIWVFVVWSVADGYVFASPVPPMLILGGMTVAIYVLVRGRPGAWAIAAFWAGVIAGTSLSIARWWVHR